MFLPALILIVPGVWFWLSARADARAAGSADFAQANLVAFCLVIPGILLLIQACSVLYTFHERRVVARMLQRLSAKRVGENNS